MSKKSKLGYSIGSPYRNNPYINIDTPNGLIDMSNTDIPLYAVDETGYEKVLMPFSGMHKFRGKKVKEIPMAQKGIKVPPKPHTQEESVFEDMAEVFDPTGLLSWGDVYRSYKDNGLFSWQTGLEVLGALPLVGKIGKLTKAGIHLSKYGKMDKALFKVLPKNNILSNTIHSAGTAGRVTDAGQAALSASTPAYQLGGELKSIDSGFKNWYPRNTREGAMGMASDDSRQSYDYESYYKDMMQGKTAYVDPKSDDHYLDTYKYPNHPSFSVESKYFTNIKEMPHALSYDGDFRKKINYDDTPLGRKYRTGGIFQQGGLTAQDAYNFLFEDDEEEVVEKPKEKAKNTAPSTEELEQIKRERQLLEDEREYNLAMDIALTDDETLGGASFRRRSGSARPSGAAAGLPSVNSATPKGVPAKGKQAFDYYVSRGLAPHVAAGIVGNLIHESAGTMDPRITGDGGKATGIAQWHPDRFKKLKDWANKTGRNPYDLTTQLDFVLEEPGEGQRALNVLKRAKNAGEAAVLFSQTYERPGLPAYQSRIGYAKSLAPYNLGGKYINSIFDNEAK